MRQKLYNYLVNTNIGINVRYHRIHDGSSGMAKLYSWIYLLWLNFAYYILHLRFIGKVPEVEAYESKRLNCAKSESEEYKVKMGDEFTVEQYVSKLSSYDIISFDVFDTLIFRPLSLPTDVFYLIGHEFGIMDFKNIRTWAEWDARVKYNAKEGNMEIGLADIWNNVQDDVGISSELGQKTEMEIEKKLCYANPFMLSVWKKLQEMNKKIIIVSDMYLPKECIEQILVNAGFSGAKKIYVSNEFHKSKADGTLYKKVLSDLKVDNGKVPSIIHIGDNPHSDQRQAQKAGLHILPYQNVNKNMLLYRTFDLSLLVGSAYRALISNKLYCGVRSYSMEYEYGYIYGGLFVVGYCTFIHEYCKKNQIDKVLFLSRDGDTLKQVYDYLYPKEDTIYVYWSRKSATKLETSFDKHDYFRRFIYHKINQD